MPGALPDATATRPNGTDLGDSPRWTALVLALGAVFFGALAVGTESATFRVHPALALLLRGFLGLLLGALSLGSLLGAVRALRPTPPAPASLRARCLGCGERTPADAPCPVCAQPPHDRAAALRTDVARWIDAALLGMGAAGVLCLGAFVAVGPYTDGERRVWVLLAMSAMALLLLAVGAAGVFGAAVDVAARWREGARVTSFWRDDAREVSGAGTALRFAGRCTLRAPLAAGAPSPSGYRAAADLRLAEGLATLEAAGLWELTRQTAWRWTLDGESLHREQTQRVTVCIASDTAWREGGLHEAVAAWIWRSVADGVSLATLCADLAAAPERRAQFDAHADALREAGVRTPTARVAAMQAALDAEAGSAT